MAMATSAWRDYVNLAMAEPYFAWFRAVAMARRRFAGLATLQEDLEERWIRNRFEQRLRISNALYTNFIEQGFDHARPLILRRPATILPTETGKVVRRDVFIADGCHRLALLVYAGALVILPSNYRIIPHKAPFRPIDNTSVMLKTTHVSMEEYLRFLALGYGEGVAEGLSSFYGEANHHNGANVDEMKMVLSHDLVLLEEPLT